MMAEPRRRQLIMAHERQRRCYDIFSPRSAFHGAPATSRRHFQSSVLDSLYRHRQFRQLLYHRERYMMRR